MSDNDVVPIPIEHDGILARGIDISPGACRGSKIPLESAFDRVIGSSRQDPALIAAAIPILIAEKGYIPLRLPRARVGRTNPNRDREIAIADRGIVKINELVWGNGGAVLELQIAPGNPTRILP